MRNDTKTCLVGEMRVGNESRKLRVGEMIKPMCKVISWLIEQFRLPLQKDL